MKTRILYTKIYSDTYFVELPPLEKLLFIYYLTNENVNILSCYECPDRKTSFDTGIDTPRIRVFQQKMESAGKMFFKDGYVFLKNASKYEQYTGGLNEKAKVKLIEQLSPEIKKWYETSMKGVYIPTINHKSEIINNKSKDNSSSLLLSSSYPEELPKILETWNRVHQKKLTSFVAIQDNYAYWRKIYPFEEIIRAIEQSPNTWLAGKSIETFFRQKNPNGERVDYVSQALNYATIPKEEVSNEFFLTPPKKKEESYAI